MRQSVLDLCPDHLTPQKVSGSSPKSLNPLQKKKKARLRYMKNLDKEQEETVQKKRKKSHKICERSKSKTGRKLTCDSDETADLEQDDIITKQFCQACRSTEREDEDLELERL